MQSGITNPLSETFRIYNSNKNIEEKDSDLRFIYHWIPKFLGYSLQDILQGKYIEHGLYLPPILDWSKTRLVNGKIVSAIRKRVRERLLANGGDEYENAIATKTTVEKYFESKDKQYKQFLELESQLENSSIASIEKQRAAQ
uniref:Uncharacterized protein n=1 Tax=Tolypothrix bouteillei VB521301 TaxID=1479485 RepID=A0A0C1R9T0_9CYAN